MNIERKGWELYATNGDMGPMVHIKTPDGRGAGVCVNGEYAMLVLEMISAVPKAPQQVSNTPQEEGEMCYDCLIGAACVHNEHLRVPQQQEQSGEAVAWPLMKAAELIELYDDATCASADHMLDATECAGIIRTFASYIASNNVGASSFKVGNKAFVSFQDAVEFAQTNRLPIEPQYPTATASQESAPGQEAVAHEFIYENGGYLHRTILQGDEASGRAFFEKNALRVDSVKALCYRTTPPTSTAIAAMVIKQAAEKCKAQKENWARYIGSNDGTAAAEIAETCRYLENEILALTPARSEAELEALMMKGVRASTDWNTAYRLSDEQARDIVQSVIRKG